MNFIDFCIQNETFQSIHKKPFFSTFHAIWSILVKYIFFEIVPKHFTGRCCHSAVKDFRCFSKNCFSTLSIPIFFRANKNLLQLVTNRLTNWVIIPLTDYLTSKLFKLLKRYFSSIILTPLINLQLSTMSTTEDIWQTRNVVKVAIIYVRRLIKSS